MNHGLTERQQAVLGLIVREFVAGKVPVASDTLVRKYCPWVSPATVRHEMVALAAKGYVRNQHTSSGRVPTDEGYRYYVRHLMPPVELSADERRMIDHQFHQVERDRDQWMDLAATVLASLTGNASFVTLPLVDRSRLRHLDLIATQDHAALLVALLQEGTLHQQLVVQPEPLVQEQLDRAARRLTLALRGREAIEVETWSDVRSPLESAVRNGLAGLMRRIDQQTTGGVSYAGVSSLLAQPEFASGDKAHGVLRAFEQRHPLAEIAEAVKHHEGVQVLIGSEIPTPALHDCAVVATRYGRWGAAGVIGIVGPKRMGYDRVIATLQYLGGLMTDLWAELCE
jgi:heat-inducible transcriptional repressor